MEQDLCKNCIRTRGMRKAVCPECHGENVQAWLEGPCMFLCCPDCGLKVIGGSFYAPCEQDDRKYELRICSQSLTREQILAVGRYRKLPVLEVKKRLDEGRLPAKELYLGPAVSTKELLEEKGISCELYPVPPYGRYQMCRRKMEIQRE